MKTAVLHGCKYSDDKFYSYANTAQWITTAVSSADCVIIITNHKVYDWEWVAKYAELIVDTRNAVRGNGRIVRL